MSRMVFSIYIIIILGLPGTFIDASTLIEGFVWFWEFKLSHRL